MPYLSATALVIHYDEALYQVYAPLPLPLSPSLYHCSSNRRRHYTVCDKKLGCRWQTARRIVRYAIARLTHKTRIPICVTTPNSVVLRRRVKTWESQNWGALGPATWDWRRGWSQETRPSLHVLPWRTWSFSVKRVGINRKPPKLGSSGHRPLVTGARLTHKTSSLLICVITWNLVVLR